MTSYQTLVNPANLTFDDEFNTFTSSPNGSAGWMTSYDYGGESARALPTNGEAQYFSDSSVGVNPFSDQNGVLTIAATVAPPGSNPYGLPYNSGMITSYKSLSQIYGYFEIDAELPAGQGLWPAFYLLPTDVANQQSEIDVFEVLGNAPGTLYTTVHWKVNGVAYDTSTSVNVANTSTGFHTYGVDWEPTTTTVYMDGQVIASFATAASMDQSMYMLAGLQVGSAGSWPGAPSSSAEFPATMEINYIRAYATANTIQVSGTQAIETAGITGQLLMAGVGWAGATVSLLNAAGTVIATTATNAAGTFSFANLAAGNYQVKYAAPAGTVLETGSEANAGTGLTPTLTLTDGQTLSLPSEVLVPPNSTSIQSNVSLFGGAGDTTLLGGDAGVTVSLLNGAGAVISSTVSDANGNFSFGSLPAGTYQLLYTPPAGQTIQPSGNASATTGLTPQFSVGAGQTVTAPSGAMVSLASIDGTVVLDGVGEAGVSVSVLNAAGTVVATATTDSAGDFAFTDLLAAGTYQLEYAPPSGQALQTGGAANAATGITPAVTLATSQVVTMATEQLLSNPGTAMSAALHFGAPTDAPAGTGEGGVTVALLNAAGVAIATAVSSSSGGFSFGGLAAGTYQLQYTAPSGQAVLPGGFVDPTTGLTAQFTVAAGQYVWAPNGNFVSNTVIGTVLLAGVGEAGVTVSLLTAAGAVVATTTSGSGGAYSFTGVVAGSYQVAYTPPSGQAIDPAGAENLITGLTAPFTVAAGQTVTAPTGALITDCIVGAVTLAGAAESGVAVSLLSAAAKVLATTTTNSTGGFSFTGLAAGSYEVKYTAPSGQVFQTGSEANAATGITPVVTLAANQALTLPAEQLLSSPGTISVVVDHYGAPTDNPWGSGEGGVTVSLLNAAGAVIATVVSSSSVISNFRQIGPGTYQLKYTAPSGQGFKPGGPENPATGLTAQFTVAAGQTVSAPMGELISTIVMNGTNLTQVAPPGGYLVTGNAGNSTLTLGNGNQYVTLTGGGDSVTTGTGNQTITLSGNNNTVTVGNGSDTIMLTGTGNTVIDTGTSSSGTINAGSGGDTVHVTGGTDNITINATGSGNLFDAGPGLNFLNADGSSGNVFMLNAAAANNISLTTITGFNPAAGDILDLKRTLAGTDILPNLSNVASLVTGSFSGANTDLWAAPAGGGKPLPFAVLDGVHVTVAQLLAAQEFSLT